MRSCGISNAKPVPQLLSFHACTTLRCILCPHFSKALQLYQSGISQPGIVLVVNISLYIELLLVTAIYIKLHYKKDKQNYNKLL